MAQHFDEVSRLQEAVIGGRLEEARTAALELANGLRDADHPPGWHVFLQDVRAGAWTAARATDLPTAARGVARAAAACGDCHAAMGLVATRVDEDAVAPPSGGLREYMMRHNWAVGRMWTGLVAPSDDAWREGATVVGEAGAFPLPKALAADPAVSALAARLATTGALAATATSSRERAQTYGELIGDCAGCHRRIGDVMD